MNIGTCIGCNKTVKYEKLNICRECEEKYVEQVKEYGYSHDLVVTMEELHKELGIPIKVLKFFEFNGFLEQIRNNAKVINKKNNLPSDKDKKLAILRDMKKTMEAEKSTTSEEQPKKTGVVMHTFRNR